LLSKGLYSTRENSSLTD